LTKLGVQVVLSFCLQIILTTLEWTHTILGSLSACGFETEVVVLHRPFFDLLRSFYSQIHPPIKSLEEFAADRVLDGAPGRDQSSVAVYTRYSQHFRNVTMRGLAAGFITRFVCFDVRAKELCRHLQTTPETHVNANKSVAYSHEGCAHCRRPEGASVGSKCRDGS